MLDNNYRPTITPKILFERLQNDIQQQQFDQTSASSLASQLSYQKSQLEHISIILNGAAMMAQPRTTLPKKISCLPIFRTSKVQRLLLKAYNFLFKEQRTVNLVTIQAVGEAATLLQQISEQTNDLTAAFQELNASIDDRINAVVEDYKSSSHLIIQKTESLDDSFKLSRQLIVQKTESIESRLSTTDRTIQFIEKNYGDRLRYLQSDIAQQKRMITLLLEERKNYLTNDTPSIPINPTASSQPAEHQSALESQLDVFYRALEDKFRGECSQIRERLQVYLPFLQETALKALGDRIVDIGCGRGEWIELLQDNGYQCLGLDINQTMLEQCKGQGLSVLESDALEYLKSLPDETLGGVTGFHIVEHLPFEYLLQVIAESHRVIKQGGVIIFETQNPHNVLVGSCNFYFDPTHRNPIPPELLQFMAQYSGFSKAKVLSLNPSDNPHVLENSDLAHRFNELFYGSMDYAVIGIKE